MLGYVTYLSITRTHCTCHAPCIILSALDIGHLVLIMTLLGKYYYYPHVMEDVTEA